MVKYLPHFGVASCAALLEPSLSANFRDSLINGLTQQVSAYLL
jgi:hypothetical protein